MKMDEFSLISKWKQPYYRQASTIKGIGDDAAVLSIPSANIVTSVDTFVENIHFTKETMKPFHIGYRALAANISDIVIMGATPVAYLVSIVIPMHYPEQSLTEIYAGMDRLAAEHRMDLIGGDTTNGSELVVSITVIGKVAPEHIRYRSAAKAGDIIFVTGTLGDSRAGLEILLQNAKITSPHREFLINRHQMPQVRSTFIEQAKPIKRMATNDISDGLASECAEIAEASNVSLIIQNDLIPLSESIRQFQPRHYNEWKWFGGEDFEMLCTISPNDWPKTKQIAQTNETNITKIGYVVEKQPSPVYIERNGKQTPLRKRGYIHQSR